MLKRDKKERCLFPSHLNLEVEYIATIQDFRENLMRGGKEKRLNTYSKHKYISGANIKIQKETEVPCFNC